MIKLLFLICFFPLTVLAQDDDWPDRSYLRHDYQSVAVVAHVRIDQAEISSRIAGYETWKLNGVVIEQFKGKFKNGGVIEFFHGAESGFNRAQFTGEKIVFLLAERDRERKLYYAVLENSTLPYNKQRIAKLRSIKKSLMRRR
jgi:hypothetical protein